MQRVTELVVVGVIRERDIGKKAARLVLQVAQHRKVRHAIGVRLDVAVEHRAITSDA